MRSKHGFTLIELLVVIAIIAILAAILFPVFTSAKASGDAASCLENAKQLALASVMYSSDNGGYVVPCLSYPDPIGSPRFKQTAKLWRGMLKPYLGSRTACVCPRLKKYTVHWFPPDAGYSMDADMPGTYAMNQQVTGWISGDQYKIYRASQFRKPSKIIIINETYGVIDAGFNLVSSIEYLKVNIIRWAPCLHSGRITVGFMDGHAKVMYLYDTIGAQPDDCLWMQYDMIPWSYQYTQSWQNDARRVWPKMYPPFAGL